MFRLPIDIRACARMGELFQRRHHQQRLSGGGSLCGRQVHESKVPVEVREWIGPALALEPVPL